MEDYLFSCTARFKFGSTVTISCLNQFYIHFEFFLLLRYSSKGHLTISQSSVAVWITFHDIGFKKAKYRYSYSLTNASFNAPDSSIYLPQICYLQYLKIFIIIVSHVLFKVFF